MKASMKKKSPPTWLAPFFVFRKMISFSKCLYAVCLWRIQVKSIFRLPPRTPTLRLFGPVGKLELDVINTATTKCIVFFLFQTNKGKSHCETIHYSPSCKVIIADKPTKMTVCGIDNYGWEYNPYVVNSKKKRNCKTLRWLKSQQN